MRLRNTGKRSGQQEVWYSEAPPRTVKEKEKVIAGGERTVEKIVTKTWQRLPSAFLSDWCKKKKRPEPLYLQAKSFQEGVLRYRVILRPPPPDDPTADVEKSCAEDLVFSPFESKLKTKKPCVAKEEAAIVAYFSIFCSPDLATANMQADPDRAEAHAKAAKHRGRFVPTVSDRLRHESAPFVEVVKLLPDPWKGFWVHMGMGKKDCLQAERWFSNHAEILKELGEPGVSIKKTAAEVVLLNKITRAQETEREFWAEQAVQPLYFAKKMRKTCLQALQVENDLEKISDRILGEILAAEEVPDEGEEELCSASSTQPTVFPQSPAAIGLGDAGGTSSTTSATSVGPNLALEKRIRDHYLENVGCQKVLQFFVTKIGFQPQDVVTALAALHLVQEGGGTGTTTTPASRADAVASSGGAAIKRPLDTKGLQDRVRTWLSVNIPEEELPEEFKVKGQFQTYAKQIFHPKSRRPEKAGAAAAGSSRQLEKTKFARLRGEIAAVVAPLVVKQGEYGFLELWKTPYSDEGADGAKSLPAVLSDDQLVAIDTGKASVGSIKGPSKQQGNKRIMGSSASVPTASLPSRAPPAASVPTTAPTLETSVAAQNEEDDDLDFPSFEERLLSFVGWTRGFLESAGLSEANVDNLVQMVQMFLLDLPNSTTSDENSLSSCCEIFRSDGLGEQIIATFSWKWRTTFTVAGQSSSSQLVRGEAATSSSSAMPFVEIENKLDLPMSPREKSAAGDLIGASPNQVSKGGKGKGRDGKYGPSADEFEQEAEERRLNLKMKKKEDREKSRHVKDYTYEYGSWFAGSPYFGMTVADFCEVDDVGEHEKSSAKKQLEFENTTDEWWGRSSATWHSDGGWEWDKKTGQWKEQTGRWDRHGKSQWHGGGSEWNQGYKLEEEAGKKTSSWDSHSMKNARRSGATTGKHRLINDRTVLNSKKHYGNAELPAFKMKEKFRRLVATQNVTLVLGQTGCGKSTQLPQFLQGNIVCTQPRKLAAISLSQRVASERGEKLQKSYGRAEEIYYMIGPVWVVAPGPIAFAGIESIGTIWLPLLHKSGGPIINSHAASVGYCVRGDVCISKKCELVFCTVGVLIRKLLEDNIDFTHLVIDEAHERSLDIDFLLMLVANHFRLQPWSTKHLFWMHVARSVLGGTRVSGHRGRKGVVTGEMSHILE
eukprot:g14907.t1